MSQSTYYPGVPPFRLKCGALYVDIISICLILPMIVLTDQTSRLICGILAIVTVMMGTEMLTHPERWGCAVIPSKKEAEDEADHAARNNNIVNEFVRSRLNPTTTQAADRGMAAPITPAGSH